jgi:molybdenum cofactor cytidylyltransferase
VAERLAGGAALVAPRYAGERGHPVGFAARFGAALAALSGDAGARDLLRAESGALEFVDCDDPGVVRDVDTPADLAG